MYLLFICGCACTVPSAAVCCAATGFWGMILAMLVQFAVLIWATVRVFGEYILNLYWTFLKIFIPNYFIYHLFRFLSWMELCKHSIGNLLWPNSFFICDGSFDCQLDFAFGQRNTFFYEVCTSWLCSIIINTTVILFMELLK